MSLEETKECLDNAKQKLLRPCAGHKDETYNPFQFLSFALGIIVCTVFVTTCVLLKSEWTNGKFMELEGSEMPRVFEFRGKLYRISRAYTELDNPDR